MAICALSIALSISTAVPAYAAEHYSSEKEYLETLKKSTEKREVDIEEPYRDYVYAKVTYNGVSYAILERDYIKMLNDMEGVTIPESEYIPPTVEVTVEPEEFEVSYEEVLPPVKDERTPWDKWDDETWNAYSSWVSSFSPDEWQSALLEYYSATEIYAYYYTGGYTIDEGAYDDYLKRKDEPRKIITQKKTSEIKSVVVPKSDYVPVVVRKELSSDYKQEAKYYVKKDEAKKVSTILKEYPKYTKDADTFNPAEYPSDSFAFEIGLNGSHMYDALKVPKRNAALTHKFLKENQVGKDYNDTSVMKFRITHLNEKTGAKEKAVYYVPYEIGYEIIESSQYLADCLIVTDGVVVAGLESSYVYGEEVVKG